MLQNQTIYSRYENPSNEIPNYKHIIWDWNGTLLDDVWLCVDVINKILKKRNLKTITVDYYKEIFDFPVETYYNRLGFDFSKESFKDVGLEFIVEYNQRHKECFLHQDALKMIRFFSENGFSQSILSARKQSSLEEELKIYKISPFMSHVVGINNNYAAGKFDVGKFFLETLPIHKKNILLIGDTIHDFEVAQKLGIDCILVSSGHQNKQKLQTCNTIIYNTLTDLNRHLQIINY